MRTALDHLPANKRDELEGVVAALFEEFRDDLTCRGNIDLSPVANFSQSILRFADFLLRLGNNIQQVDTHFRPQVNNLFIDGNQMSELFQIDRIIKLEQSEQMESFFNSYAPNFLATKEKFNASDEGNFDLLYSPTLDSLVHEIYKIDYDTFNY